VTNSPTPDKSLSKAVTNPVGQKPDRPWLRLLVRGVVLGIGAIAGIGIGLAIAIMRPEWVWQPSEINIFSKKQQFTLSADALFDSGTAKIKTDSFQLLDKVAAQLPLSTGRKIRINGHTDVASGVDALNLSYLRANAVQQYLAKLRGERTYQWMVVGYGASRPLSNSADKVSGNNRIEIVVDD
jgi:outer membrane protein OmpA-like peptidoglycan-associated protein